MNHPTMGHFKIHIRVSSLIFPAAPLEVARQYMFVRFIHVVGGSFNSLRNFVLNL